MRVVKFALALAAALTAQVVLLRLLPESTRILDLFLIVAVINALDGDSFAGLSGGLAAGLTRDALSGRLFGLNGFADTLVGYVVARVAQRLDLQRRGAVLVVVALATLLQQAVLIVMAFLFFPNPEPPDPAWVTIMALANGVVGLLLYFATSWTRRARDQALRRRMSRLRL